MRPQYLGGGIDVNHEVQNHVNDGLIADRGIDHGVVDGAVRPFDVEILLDEIGALPIDGIHELFGFLLTLAASQQAAALYLPSERKEIRATCLRDS